MKGLFSVSLLLLIASGLGVALPSVSGSLQALAIADDPPTPYFAALADLVGNATSGATYARLALAARSEKHYFWPELTLVSSKAFF